MPDASERSQLSGADAQQAITSIVSGKID